MSKLNRIVRRSVGVSVIGIFLAVIVCCTEDISSYFTAADSRVSQFIVDTVAPTLTVITPGGTSAQDPTYAVSDTYLVTGNVSDTVGIRHVTVNGKEATVNSSGSWTGEILLPDGETLSVEVVATDLAGNMVTETRYVRYDSSITFVDFTVTRWNRSMIGYTDDTTELVIPETFYHEDSDTWYRVVAIGFSEGTNMTVSRAPFSNCTQLTSVTIPGTVKQILQYAFYQCTGITDLSLGEGVEYIGMAVFQGCTAITGKLVIPNTVKLLGNSAFAYNEKLTSVNIPESLTAIYPHTFLKCSSLTGELIIPSSVTTISSGAFAFCYGLTGVVIPEGVTSLKTDAFRECKSMTWIVIPAGVTSIGEYAFYKCVSLTNVCYKGSAEQWSAIHIAKGNGSLTDIQITYDYKED